MRLMSLERPALVRDVQWAELDSLTSLRLQATGVAVDQMKEDTAAIARLKAANLKSQLEKHFQKVFDDHGINDNCALEEIAEVVQRHTFCWAGMENSKQEEALRKKVFPYVQPRERVLKPATNLSKAKLSYDIPVEESIALMWQAKPELYYLMMQYMKQMHEKQKVTIAAWQNDPNHDWEVTDYYDAICGLEHAYLGKSENWLGLIAYMDGIDIVNPIGVFAGKKKVVVHLPQILALPPAARCQFDKLIPISIAFEKDIKGIGYTKWVSGDPSNMSCSSYGGSSRRLHAGLLMPTPEGERLFRGGHYAFVADNPQANNLLSTKESVGPTTKQICKQCMCSQAEMRDLNLELSYLSDTPPCTLRTTQLQQYHRTELKGMAMAQRKRQAMQWGYILNKSNTDLLSHAFEHCEPAGAQYVWTHLNVETMHDMFLGVGLDIWHISGTFWTRETSNSNHFTFERLIARWEEYPWGSVPRGDIPTTPRYFKTKDKKAKGKKVYGNSYGGWPVPTREHNIKWTASM